MTLVTWAGIVFLCGLVVYWSVRRDLARIRRDEQARMEIRPSSKFGSTSRKGGAR